MGGEENLARKPIVYEDRNYLAPNNYFYTEYPYIESLFPSPVIGYSNVKVESINNAVDQRTATGWTEHDFYTAKDFPTIVRVSNKVEHPYSMLPILTPFVSLEMEKMTATQGYVIESNDMHGKMKASRVYNARGGLLEGTSYQYLVDDPNAEILQLNNTVQVANDDRTIELTEIGVEANVWQEMTQHDTYVNTGGAQTQTEVAVNFIPPFLPPVIPVTTIIPSMSSSFRQLRTSITTKHIRRYGIVEKVIVTKHGSSLESENLLYDAETGQIVLSSTQNEFEDPVYSWTFPAHWAYDGMGGAYQNIRATIPGITISENTGRITGLPDNVYWTDGDEVLVRSSNENINPERYYLYEGMNTGGSNAWYMMDATGQPADISETVDALIIRSGYRNHVMDAMQTVMLLDDPRENLSDGSIILLDPIRMDVIQASAIEMKDEWAFNCENKELRPFGNALIEEVNFPNIFLTGAKGHWRPYKKLAMYSNGSANNAVGRNSEEITVANSPEKSIDQKSSGEVRNSMHWIYSDEEENWLPMPNSDWIATEEFKYYDRLGTAIESKDALDVARAAQYGYNNTSPVGVVANAELREVGFETFEDYFFDNAANTLSSPRHFYLLSPFFNPDDQAKLTTTTAHSGRYSLALNTSNIVVFPIGEANCEDVNLTEHYGLEFDCEDCLPRFSPYANREYHFSAWAADEGTLDCAPNLDGAQITISFKKSDGTVISGEIVTITPDQVPIDGWQRLQSSFTIPMDAAYMYLTLQRSQGQQTYYDDLRIIPEDAVGKGFVYDPESMRLMAELDDNNYATYYEYDDAGLLSRVKRETERGIVTIQEGRTAL
ncbi:MAG: hypothetical protein AAGJ93_10175, partial [Bacteroidota bacterium]